MATVPSNAEIEIRALSDIKNQDTLLFSQTPYFWRLSDLSILYPRFFDIKKPIQQSVAHNLAKTVSNAIPEFASIIQTPVHILSIKETYKIGNHELVKNGLNQHLTNVACEYLFNQQRIGSYLAQAYFLKPNEPINKIVELSADLRFARVRSHIADLSATLSGIINRAKYSNNNSYRDVWATIWRYLYNIQPNTNLREKYGIKSSSIDYVGNIQWLINIDILLNSIVKTLSTRPEITINDIERCAAAQASNMRKMAIYKNIIPERQLTEKSTAYKIEKIQNMRKKFWSENYMNSL